MEIKTSIDILNRVAKGNCGGLACYCSGCYICSDYKHLGEDPYDNTIASDKAKFLLSKISSSSLIPSRKTRHVQIKCED